MKDRPHIPQMGSKSQSHASFALWIRVTSALFASIAFHFAVIYVAGNRLRLNLLPPVVALDVRLAEAILMPQAPPLINTIEGEEAPPSETQTPPVPKEADEPTPLPPRKLEKLLTRLSDTLPYPPEALAAGWEGETVLAVHLDANARIVSVSVVSSSGHMVLDEAALRAVHHLRSLGPELRNRSVLFPVRFELN